MSDFIKRFAFLKFLSDCYRSYGSLIFYGVLFALPVKLSLAYIFLFPLIIIALINFYHEKRWREVFTFPAITIWGVFILTLLLSSPFGIEPLRSFTRSTSLLVYSLSIPIFIDLLPRINVIKALSIIFSAQALVSIHSIFEFFNPGTKQIFVGTISESGQIAIVMPLLLGAILEQRNKSNTTNAFKIFLYFCAALIFAALLMNLKRGPLSGVLCAMFILAALVRCRVCLLIFVLLLLPALFFEPLQIRIMQSSEHFFIRGGRSEIWSIGLKLLQEYPLGIGFSNSPFLQKFSLTIPPELKHFHNNFINIIVETGIMGFCLFAAFIINLLKLAFAKRSNVLVAAAGVALLSNQIAGLVEYNLGDSEVLLVVFFAAAMIIALPGKNQSPAQ